MDEDQYQDIRVNGKTVSYGMRECESRYKAMKPFLERYKHEESFNVLDFGANYGYFSWRIKEDFPNAKITMVDSRPVLKLLFEINNMEGMELISEDMQLDQIKEFFKGRHYDLILLMSIVHHFTDPEEIIDTFMAMAETVLFEIDYSDQPNFTGLQERVYEYLMTKNPIQINNWIEHTRPLYYVNDEEMSIEGKVSSGKGEAAASLINHTWILNWFGIELCPGTLNIIIGRSINFRTILLMDMYALMKIYINGFPVFAIRDTTRPLSEDGIEIISPYNLRNKFNLKDGDEVVISFEKKMLG